jgi:nucleoside-diphosphate-sugar epimerase
MAKKNSLFVTGCSGFIGRHLLRKLDFNAYENVYGLSRTADESALNLSHRRNFQVIRGSLFDGDRYARYLGSSYAVIHLAAVTGKARPEEYFKVNAEGTEYFIGQCARAGVQNVLYVSSIAAKFPESSYYYAQSKRRAEDAVRSSRLRYSIVRPTMVIGKESPILASLSRLARAPVVPIFGDGRARIQPIDVDDVVVALLSIVDGGIFGGETIELGGPEILTIHDFIMKIRQSHNNKHSRSLHIPLKVLVPVIAFMERRFFGAAPFTVGQLSSFSSDGVAESDRRSVHPAPMKGIDEMLRLSRGNTGTTRVVPQTLDHECLTFCRYLMSAEPSRYVLEKYRDGHERSLSSQKLYPSRFDCWLVRTAQRSPFFTRLADSYAGFFFRDSLLKKKLVLLLAVLESCPPTDHHLDLVESSGKALLYAKMALRGMAYVSALLLSVIAFLPVRVMFAGGEKLFSPKEKPPA